MLSALLDNLAGTIDPAHYVRELGVQPFVWQAEALDPTIRRLLLLCARQAGKSTIVAGKALNKAKYTPFSLILIVCPAQHQSKEVMEKIALFLARDPNPPRLINDATFEKKFENGSRIVALPGSEKSVRSYSGPKMIIVDEGARVLDQTYRAVRPMMVGADTELVVPSTAFGKRGFFWEAWKKSKRWTKILVRVAYDVRDGKLVPAMPEKRFREYWRKRGVLAYYSPRHDLEFLQDELEAIGEWWFRQEYCCEFLDPVGSAFNTEDIIRALSDSVEPLIGDGISYDVPLLEVK